MNNKTQSCGDDPGSCALDHPSTITSTLPAHSAPLPPASLCSLDTRNKLSTKGLCTCLSLCLEFSCSRPYNVIHTHFLKVLAEVTSSERPSDSLLLLYFVPTSIKYQIIYSFVTISFCLSSPIGCKFHKDLDCTHYCA